ncbi:MAG: S-layer homology domain-containing protein [Candidatus Gracilibacteria bacterium]
MKTIKLLAVMIGILATISIAFASGGFIQHFSDVVEGDWYAESVSKLYDMDVIEGYSDGTYLPGANVNRAEMAVTLDRFYDYIQYPSGEDWVSYENDYYSVMLPHGAYNSSADCSVADDLEIDGGFNVTCYSAVDHSIEDLIASMGDQFEDSRREVRSVIEVNGQDATLVSVTTLDYRTWEYNAVFVEDGTSIYMISDAALNMYDDFEYFYSTFKKK